MKFIMTLYLYRVYVILIFFLFKGLITSWNNCHFSVLHTHILVILHYLVKTIQLWYYSWWKKKKLLEIYKQCLDCNVVMLMKICSFPGTESFFSFFSSTPLLSSLYNCISKDKRTKKKTIKGVGENKLVFCLSVGPTTYLTHTCTQMHTLH